MTRIEYSLGSRPLATFALVHGAWHGGWCWDGVRAELEARGHDVVAPDLPCEDVDVGVEEYVAVVQAALGDVDDAVLVGHSLGGMTIPRVPARLHVFVSALLAGTGWNDVFAPGFGDSRVRDELGRSYYPDPADAVRELQYPPELASAAQRLRRQARYEPEPVDLPGCPVYVVCTRDAAIRPDWQRHLARDVLGVEPLELEAGHSPMLERPRELAELLHSLAREAE
jgi:pimeloyl-ACP methyl ester carboxylesterase